MLQYLGKCGNDPKIQLGNPPFTSTVVSIVTAKCSSCRPWGLRRWVGYSPLKQNVKREVGGYFICLVRTRGCGAFHHSAPSPLATPFLPFPLPISAFRL